jgi:hypothetical protein
MRAGVRFHFPFEISVIADNVVTLEHPLLRPVLLMHEGCCALMVVYHEGGERNEGVY